MKLEQVNRELRVLKQVEMNMNKIRTTSVIDQNRAYLNLYEHRLQPLVNPLFSPPLNSFGTTSSVQSLFPSASIASPVRSVLSLNQNESNSTGLVNRNLHQSFTQIDDAIEQWSNNKSSRLKNELSAHTLFLKMFEQRIRLAQMRTQQLKDSQSPLKLSNANEQSNGNAASANYDKENVSQSIANSHNDNSSNKKLSSQSPEFTVPINSSDFTNSSNPQKDIVIHIKLDR